MSEFTYLFRGGFVSASPEQMQKTMEKWLAWREELAAKGHIKDLGIPLEGTGKVVQGSKRVVNDGPYAETKDIINGFMLIEAEDLPHAVEIAKTCPILDGGGSVEVRPIAKLSR
ncbi:Uncharacterized conserved protein [Rhizobiales bacterium GAS113]|nr:Uncharacterized conserved protein [Rhizobiales bacterium GAS113]